ncbi:MAG: pyridoxal phosphate-dependent aminotransferase [Spirochaetaceae bacterium]
MAYRENKLHETYRSVSAEGPVLSLVESNFHQCGFLPPAAPFEREFARFVSERQYRPHPHGAPSARRAVTALDEQAGVSTSPEQVILTASTSEAYLLLFTTLLRERKRVLLPAPGYPLFDYLADQAGMETVYYPLSPSAGYRLRSRQLPQGGAASRVGAAVLVSPGNPTGHIMREQEIRRICRFCRKQEIPLIADEVFSGLLFGEEEYPFPKAAALAEKEGVTVITLNGISKLIASPDLKLGWMTVHGPKAEAKLEELAFANDLLLGANAYIQHALPGLIDALGSFREEMRSAIAARREAAIDAFSTVPGMELLPGEGGIYSTLIIGPEWREREYDDERITVSLLEEERLYLHPGYFYGGDELGEGEDFLVVTHLSPEEKLREGAARLRRWAERHARGNPSRRGER